MSEEPDARIFRLADMSGSIRTLTLVVLLIPAALAFGAGVGAPVLAAPAIFTIALYLWTWCRWRPTAFVITRRGLDIVWPLKRRELASSEIESVRLIDREQLAAEVGWRYRIGVGGLWGVFGYLRTQRRGIVQTYISRLDRFVWIETRQGRPWLITPAEPERFVAMLSGA